jgi:hypothetical protein
MNRLGKSLKNAWLSNSIDVALRLHQYRVAGDIRIILWAAFFIGLVRFP